MAADAVQKPRGQVRPCRTEQAHPEPIDPGPEDVHHGPGDGERPREEDEMVDQPILTGRGRR